MAHQSDTYVDENELYHKDTSRVSKSALDQVHKSPLHYYTNYLDPKKPKRKETAAFAEGKACHTALFEASKFGQRYVIMPDKWNLRTNAGKDDRDKFLADNQNKICITKEEFELAMAIQKAVRAHPKASILIERGEPEKTIEWTDPETGINMKSRLDFKSRTKSGIFIVDLKTTEDASKEAFGRSSYNYRYHVQEAIYLDGDKLASKEPADNFIFIAVEKKYPYPIALYYADEYSYNLGKAEYTQDLRVLKTCLDTGYFPGYPEEIQPLTLPAWAYKKQQNF